MTVQEVGLDSSSVTPVAQRAFLIDGHVSIDDLWTEAFACDLAEEAQASFRLATVPKPINGRERPPILPSRAPSSQTTEADAPLLSGLHLALVGIARGLTGRMLVPAFAVYNYYEADDGVWLHVDSVESDLTLLTTALGGVGPLRVHPELEGMTLAELEVVEHGPAWDDANGIPVRYPRRGVTAMAGRRLPHHRTGQPVAQLSAVAALHYTSLF